jgi:Zn finger protein HypA/HybF involved in hydrogenase expression
MSMGSIYPLTLLGNSAALNTAMDKREVECPDCGEKRPEDEKHPNLLLCRACAEARWQLHRDAGGIRYE